MAGSKDHVVKKTITLPVSGKAVEVDYEALRRDVVTRNDMKKILNLGKGDEYDRWLERYTDLGYDELGELHIKDYQAVDRALGEAIQALLGPNSN